MQAMLKGLKERLNKPELDDPEQTEYTLNRLKTAIHNFKKVQLPKIQTHEKTTLYPTRSTAVPYHARRKPKLVHG